MNKKVCVASSVGQKLEIIRRVGNGEDKKKIANELGVGYSTICKIIKNKEKYETMGGSSLTMKRARTLKYDKVDKAVRLWFEQMRVTNVPISGEMLKTKAIEFARQVGENGFEASNGWLDRFKLWLVLISYCTCICKLLFH